MPYLDHQQVDANAMMGERIQERHSDKADKFMQIASSAFLPKAEDIGESKGLINSKADKSEGLINSKADKSDEAKQKKAIYMVLHLVDWAQTRDLTRKIGEPGSTWHEQNPVLGRAPHQDKVDAYFALTGLAKMYLDNNLPEKWKEPFQDLMIGIEKGAVGNNFNIGIKAKF